MSVAGRLAEIADLGRDAERGGYSRHLFDGSDAPTGFGIVEGSGLGILRRPDVSVFEGMRDWAGLDEARRAHLRDPAPLTVTKANLRSTVHRAVHLDVVLIKPVSRRELVRTYPKLFDGSHVTHPQYEHHRVRRVTVAAPGIVGYADGERFGPLPLTVESVPGALEVIV